MCSLTVYQNLLNSTQGQPSGLELSYQFGSLATLLDTMLVHGTLGFERDRNWLNHLQEACLERVVSLTEPSGYDNAEYLRQCKADLKGLKSTIRDLFARSHRAYRLNPILRDVGSLAYGQRPSATAGDPYVFSRAGYDASHFTSLREYADVLGLLTPFLRSGCFALATFNRVQPATGLPLDFLNLAEALERSPGFEAPPSHSPLLFSPQPASTLDVELVADLRLVCDVLGLHFGSVSLQLVTYTVVRHGNPLGNSPFRALRTADFRLLAHHTAASLRLLRQFEDAQRESGNEHLPIGNDVARAVVRTQVAWFERLWEDEHGTLRFSVTQLGRDVQLRVRDGLRLDWGRTAPLFDWTEQVRWVDETQDERWITWLRDSEVLETRSFYEDEDPDWDGDGGDDGDPGDALRPRPVQATTGFPRARRHAIVPQIHSMLLPPHPARSPPPVPTGNPPALTREERLERGLRVGTGLFVSAEHFVYTRMVNQLLAAMRSLRAEPDPDRALLLDADTRSRVLNRVAQLSSLEFPSPLYLHPVHAHLWDRLHAFFAHATLGPQPLGPSQQHELERLSDLLVAGWEEPDLLPEHFDAGSSTVDPADSFAVLQWLTVLFACADNLDPGQASALVSLFTQLEPDLALTAARPLSGSSADDRSFHRWRLVDLPHWVTRLHTLGEEHVAARLEAEHQEAVALAATREQHAALLAALPRSLHPSVNFLHPDTLTHANANPQYEFLLNILSTLAREEEELRTRDPTNERMAVIATQRLAYGTAVRDIIQAEASRREAPEFGPVTDAESVPPFFTLPELGVGGLLPFTPLAHPGSATHEDQEEADVDLPDWGDADGYFRT